MSGDLFPVETTPKGDPRHRAITEAVGGLYLEATKSAFAFSVRFPTALKAFLRGWTGSADEWLDRYWDVLQFRTEPYAGMCRRAADPYYLCRNWAAVEAEVATIKAQRDRKRPSQFTKSI